MRICVWRDIGTGCVNMQKTFSRQSIVSEHVGWPVNSLLYFWLISDLSMFLLFIYFFNFCHTNVPFDADCQQL